MTDSEALRAHSATPRRRPSRSFASYPLRGAVDGVKAAGASGADHSRDAFASYLGHETTNSGGFKRKLASMKDWGLVETRDDRVVITDLGMRIAHPRTDEDERNAIREAFLQAGVFTETYNDLAKGIDLSAERIGSMGVHEHGISPGAKADFARSFVESAVYAGLGHRNADGSIRLAGDSETEASRGADVADDVEAGPQSNEASRDQRRSALPSEGGMPTIHQAWNVEDGSVLFEVRLDRPLPSAAFGTLAEVMRTVEKLVSSLGPDDAQWRTADSQAGNSSGDAAE